MSHLKLHEIFEHSNTVVQSHVAYTAWTLEAQSRTHKVKTLNCVVCLTFCCVDDDNDNDNEFE